jgi:TPR repeat protein
MLLRIMICILCSVLFMLGGCSTIRQHNLNEGIRNFRVQDYRQAFIRLKPEAERGQPDAQYAIGYMYYYGQGVIEDRKKACIWIARAAKAGQPEAIIAAKRIRKLQLSHPYDKRLYKGLNGYGQPDVLKRQ